MTVKGKVFVFICVIVFILVCLSGLVYAAVEKFGKPPITRGTFVYYELPAGGFEWTFM